VIVVLQADGGTAVVTQVVTYQVDDLTKVRFEVEPVEGFRPAGAGQIAGRVRDAVAPAVDAAKAVLDKVKEVRPDEIEVRFGVKVSGGADWFVAKSAGEASFEIKLRWTPNGEHSAAGAEASGAGSQAGNDAESGGTRDSGADEE
jgi:Trypsin-co-occurring domain 1